MKNIGFLRNYLFTLLTALAVLIFVTGKMSAQAVPQELLQRVAAFETKCRALESAYEFDQIKQTAADVGQITAEAYSLLAADLNNAFKQKLYYCRGLAAAFPAYNHRFEHNVMANNIFHVSWKNRYDLVYTAEETESLRKASADFRRAVTTADEFLSKTLSAASANETEGAQKMIRLVAANRLTSATAYATALLEIATCGTQTETDFQIAADAADALTYAPQVSSNLISIIELRKTRGCALIGAGKSFAEVAAEFDAWFELRPEAVSVISSQARRCFMQTGDARAANAYTLHLATRMKARNLSAVSIAENTKIETEFSKLQSPTALPLSQLRFGVMELSAGKPTAESYLEAAHKISPKRVLPLIALAQFKYQQKNPDEAIRYAALALAIEPNNAGALAVRGFAYAAQNDAANAEKDLSAAIKSSTELAFAYGVFVTRARIYQSIGKAELAAADLAQHQELLTVFR